VPNLRGHHLICLHFFRGEGYNPEFVENLGSVLGKASATPIKVVRGADDVCSGCPHSKNDKCLYSDNSDKEIRKMDERALDLLRVEENAEIGWREIEEKLPSVFIRWHAFYCRSCEWRKACETDALYRRMTAIAVDDPGSTTFLRI
jgi:hypothetical protein